MLKIRFAATLLLLVAATLPLAAESAAAQPPPACPQTVTAPAEADSWVTEADKDKNFGTDGILKVTSKGPADNTRALLRFALPTPPPGCAATSATLRVFSAATVTGRTIQAMRLTSSWTEPAVTWNNQPATTGQAATVGSGLGWREWSVTEQVQTMYAGANHGFLIRDAAETDPAAPEQSYHGREKAPDNPPELVISFGPPAQLAVTSTTDAVDAVPGDGVCATATAVCTLRAAIQEANAVPGSAVVTLPAGTYPITIPPLNQNDITSGDFDITDDLTITGAGRPATTITGGTPPPGAPPQVTGLDRIFAVAPGVSAVSISGLAMRNGYAAEHGGALFNEGAATVTLTDVTVADGGAGKTGGGVENRAGGTVRLVSSQVSGNTAVEDGGAVNNSGGTMTVTASTFTANRGGNGGAISNDGSGALTVADSTFTDNVATTEGGAVANNDTGTVTITNTTFTGNAGANGGGFANGGDGVVSVTASTFTGNHANGLVGQGGAIRNDSDGRFVLLTSTLGQNDARDGAGIANIGDGTLEITDTTFSANVAHNDGGGILIDSGAVVITEVDVLGNSASRNGGGISYLGDKIVNGGETVVISRSRISDNAANPLSGTGGGIDSRGDGELGVAETIIGSNRAFIGGGIHHVGDAPLALARSTVTLNQAGAGGGFFTSSDGSTTITETTVSENSATSRGGGLFIESDAATLLENSTVSGNTAATSGGGLLLSSAQADLVYVTVTANSAPSGGGLSNLTGDGFVRPLNSIIANNPTGGNCVGTVTSQGGNLENTDTCTLRAEGDQINVDPKIAALADNGGPTRTHALLVGSPALNSAIPAALPAFDQRGTARPQGPAADLGSFESTTPGCTATLVAVADQDSWVDEGDPTKNNGADAILKVTSKSPANDTRALIRFALPALAPGCTVAGATLELHNATAVPGRTIEALRVAAPWTEAGVSWNDQPATAGPAATTASGPGVQQWSVTAQVQAMYAGANQGFLIRDAVEGDIAGPEQQYHSREKAPDNPPRLVITYE